MTALRGCLGNHAKHKLLSATFSGFTAGKGTHATFNRRAPLKINALTHDPGTSNAAKQAGQQVMFHEHEQAALVG